MHTVLYCCPSLAECQAHPQIPFPAIHRQQKKLLHYCQQHLLTIDAIYTDVTAPFSLSNRPALANLLEDGQNQQYQTLLVLSPDTLCCNRLLQSVVLQLFQSHHIHLICCESE